MDNSDMEEAATVQDDNRPPSFRNLEEGDFLDQIDDGIFEDDADKNDMFQVVGDYFNRLRRLLLG